MCPARTAGSDSFRQRHSSRFAARESPIGIRPASGRTTGSPHSGRVGAGDHYLTNTDEASKPDVAEDQVNQVPEIAETNSS